MSTMGAVAAAPRSLLESRPLLPLCAPWHCQDEEKATEYRLWAALTQTVEDCLETVVLVPVLKDGLSVLTSNGGDKARFSKETGDQCALCTA